MIAPIAAASFYKEEGRIKDRAESGTEKEKGCRRNCSKKKLKISSEMKLSKICQLIMLSFRSFRNPKKKIKKADEINE